MILAVVSVTCQMPREPVSRDRNCVRVFINLFAAAMAGPTEVVVRLSGTGSLSDIKGHAGFIRSGIGRGGGEGGLSGPPLPGNAISGRHKKRGATPPLNQHRFVGANFLHYSLPLITWVSRTNSSRVSCSARTVGISSASATHSLNSSLLSKPVAESPLSRVFLRWPKVLLMMVLRSLRLNVPNAAALSGKG